jgi:hypothetical protein
MLACSLAVLWHDKILTFATRKKQNDMFTASHQYSGLHVSFLCDLVTLVN